MKILLTGGSGFLGSALTRQLRSDGHDLVLLLRPASSLARLPWPDLEVCRPTTDTELFDIVQHMRPDAVVHTACSYGRRGETLLQLSDTNLRLGISLLQALPPASEDGPRLFLNTGTALPPEVSAYALSKQQFAQWGRAQALADPKRLRFVNVQLEHMYGPGDDPSKFTTHVLHACRRHDTELRLTAGEQRRDFIFIDDVVDGYVHLLKHGSALGTVADVPLGSGEAPSVRHFVETVHRLVRSRTRLLFGALPYRPHEAMHCQADLTTMGQMGWTPRWSLTEGLRRTIDLEFTQTI